MNEQPNKHIDFKQILAEAEKTVPYIQLLNEAGERVESEVTLSLSEDEQVELMKELVWGRTVDGRLVTAGLQGRIGNMAPAEGQEAVQLASLRAMSTDDFLMPTYREDLAFIKHGFPLERNVLRLRGKMEGNLLPAGLPSLLPQVMVSSQILQATGLGMAYAFSGEPKVVLTFIGDGGTSQGDFYEGINFAGIFKAPVIYIVQNNQYGISVPRSKQTKATTLAQKAIAVGIPGLQVDGMDPLAIYEVARQAREYALAGNGPVLIEALTYRFRPHTLSDDPTIYRSEAENEKWRKKDWLLRMRRYLEAKGLWSEAIEADVVAAAREEVAQALDLADKAAPEQISKYLAAVYEKAPGRLAQDIALYQAKEGQENG